MGTRYKSERAILSTLPQIVHIQKSERRMAQWENCLASSDSEGEEWEWKSKSWRHARTHKERAVISTADPLNYLRLRRFRSLLINDSF